MSDNDAAIENVIAFEPKRQPAPELKFVEFRLDEVGDLEMTLYDEANNIAAVLTYGIEDRPDGFALSSLIEAWDRWRGSSARAS